jgi:dihydrolipoamide dehydrogenase
MVAQGSHDLAVIGAGPGGYVAAIRASQLGLKVASIEREEAPGGTCLRIGCIPSKALLESSERLEEARSGLGRHGIRVGEVSLDLAAMMRRKSDAVKVLTRGVASLLDRNKVERLRGVGRLAGPGRVEVEGPDGTRTVEARHVVLATGSRAGSLPGVAPDGDRIGTSTEALAWPEVPGHLVVMGAGYIGLELGSVWRRLGAKVTVLEALDRILAGMDREVAAEAAKQLARQGLEIRLGAAVRAARVEGERCRVEVEGHEPLDADRVLVAVGRRPATDGLGLDTVGIELDHDGRIPVDERLRTRAQGVYAIGDLVRGPMLAHKASEEGIACVEGIATGSCRVNYDAIPAVVYTRPEVAGVGRSEDQLEAAGVGYRKGVFPFRGNARARTLGDVDGLVKVLADAATDRVLGVHAVGPRVSELVAEAAVAMEFGASSEDLARSCHAHPTLSEALREAALAVAGRAIHI